MQLIILREGNEIGSRTMMKSCISVGETLWKHLRRGRRVVGRLKSSNEESVHLLLLCAS